MNLRTKQFAVDVVLFAQSIEKIPVVRWLAKQFVDAATRLSIVVEEADEAAFWCELLRSLPLPTPLMPELNRLTDEAQQLLAIFAKGRSTVRSRLVS